MERLKTIIHTQLLKAERTTKVNLRVFLKGWSWLFSSQVVGTIMALLLAYGYANFLSQEIYGTYKYVLSVISILSLFSLHGMEYAAQRSIANKKDAVFWTIFKLRIQWGAVGALLCAGVGFYYFVNGNMLLATSFLVASPFLIFIDTLNHFRAVLIGRQLYREMSYFSIFTQVVAALVIFATLMVSKNVTILIFAYMGVFVALRGTIFLYVIRKHSLNRKNDPEAIKYGVNTSVVSVIGQATGKLDSILLWHFLGPASLAIYSFATAVVTQLRRTIKLVTTSMAFPKFSQTDTKTIQKTLPRKVIIAHIIVIPFVIGFVLIIPYLYKTLFPQYIESIPYAQVMTLLLVFSPLRFFSTAIMAKGSIKSIYTLNLTSSILHTSFLLVAIPFFGIWGIILAMAVQQTLSNFLAFYLFRRM